MDLMRRRWVNTLLVALVAGVLPSVANAATGRTVYVDDNGAANAAAR
jgi:hypothetical protein